MELYSSVQSSSQNENITNTNKKLLKTRYWTFSLALKITPGFYMECYTWLKCVKREYSLPKIWLCQNVSKDVLLTEPKNQAKIPNHKIIAWAWSWTQGFMFDLLWQFIAKCDRYYQTRQLLQNATVITNCGSIIVY